jgi:hypothetical protein
VCLLYRTAPPVSEHNHDDVHDDHGDDGSDNTNNTDDTDESHGLGINVAPGSLGAIVRSYKATVARRTNRLRQTPGAVVWQRGYWERVVRDERELNATHRYIINNSVRWAMDRDNLDVLFSRMTKAQD